MAERRSTSPFLSLPDTHVESNQKPPSLPPITVSCASCRTIVGDSSSFVSVTRELGGITLDKAIGVTLGDARSTGDEGVDRLCLYKPVECGECKVELGKMYIAASDTRLDSLRHKYTLQRTKLAFYQHGVGVPSLPPADSEEILRQIHPDPDEIAQNVERLTTFVMYMKEEQENMMIELQKLADKCNVEINLPHYVQEGMMEDDSNGGGHIATDSAIGSGDSGVGSRVFDQMRAMQEELETIKRQMREIEPGSRAGTDSRQLMRPSDYHIDDSDGGTSPDPAHYTPSAAAQLKRSRSSNKCGPSTPQRSETPQTTATFRPRKLKTGSSGSPSKSTPTSTFVAGLRKSTSRPGDAAEVDKSRNKRRASDVDAEAHVRSDNTEDDEYRDHADTEDNGRANSDDAENRPPPSFAKRKLRREDSPPLSVSRGPPKTVVDNGNRGKFGEGSKDRLVPTDTGRDRAKPSDSGKHRTKQAESSTDADAEARNTKKRRVTIANSEPVEIGHQDSATQSITPRADDRDKERISRSTRASFPGHSVTRSGQLHPSSSKGGVSTQSATKAAALSSLETKESDESSRSMKRRR